MAEAGEVDGKQVPWQNKVGVRACSNLHDFVFDRLLGILFLHVVFNKLVEGHQIKGVKLDILLTLLLFYLFIYISRTSGLKELST